MNYLCGNKQLLKKLIPLNSFLNIYKVNKYLGLMSTEIDFLIIGDSSTYATWMEMKEINFVKNLTEARGVKRGELMGWAK